jgi:hypothetical protein
MVWIELNQSGRVGPGQIHVLKPELNRGPCIFGANYFPTLSDA